MGIFKKKQKNWKRRHCYDFIDIGKGGELEDRLQPILKKGNTQLKRL